MSFETVGAVTYTYGDARTDIPAAIAIAGEVSDPQAPTLQATLYSMQLNVTDTASFPDQMAYDNAPALVAIINTLISDANADSFNQADSDYNILKSSKATGGPLSQPKSGAAGQTVDQTTTILDNLGLLDGLNSLSDDTKWVIAGLAVFALIAVATYKVA